MRPKAFTLLELIIVMGIVAFMMGLGVVGLIKFQGTVQLQSVYSDFITNLKTLQNKAKNAINTSSTNNKAPYVYAMIFGQNSYTFYDCDKATSTTLVCTQDSSMPAINTNQQMVSFTGIGCNAVGFVKLTGDFVSIDTTNFTWNSAGSCAYTLTHTSANVTKSLTVNLTNNSIDLP